jgi:hypothetical protein
MCLSRGSLTIAVVPYNLSTVKAPQLSEIFTINPLNYWVLLYHYLPKPLRSTFVSKLKAKTSLKKKGEYTWLLINS